MNNNKYKIKRKIKSISPKTLTEKDSSITDFFIKKLISEPYGKLPSSLHVCVNGKQIKNQLPRKFKKLQTNAEKSRNNNRLSTKDSFDKKINLQDYIYRKYLSEGSEHSITSDSFKNPNLQKLVQLRKIFNQKYRNDSGSDITGKRPSEQIDKNKTRDDTSKIIKVTNPDIYAGTFSRKFIKQTYKSKETFQEKLKNQEKLKHKYVQQNSLKKMNQTHCLISPWKID